MSDICVFSYVSYFNYQKVLFYLPTYYNKIYIEIVHLKSNQTNGATSSGPHTHLTDQDFDLADTGNALAEAGHSHPLQMMEDESSYK